MPTSADTSFAPGLEELRGRTILLNGATGAVGRALVERLSAAGARLAIAVRKPWQVSKLASPDEPSRRLIAHVPSRDGEAAAGFVKGVVDSLGPIDAYVSAAGAFRSTPVGRDPDGTALELMEANFLCVHNLVRAVVPPMTRRESGSLVFTGAAATGTPSPGSALYLASKSALREYAASLAAELAPARIAVSLVAPGVIDTPANRVAMPGADPARWVPLDLVVDALCLAAVRGTAGDLHVIELPS